jgi:putative membrane protein
MLHEADAARTLGVSSTAGTPPIRLIAPPDEWSDPMIGRFSLRVYSFLWLPGMLARKDQRGPANDGYMDGYGHMMDYWGGGVVMWLLLLVVVGVLVYFLVKASQTGGFRPTPQETPLDILKKRYARGEITKEQFEEMKKDL